MSTPRMSQATADEAAEMVRQHGSIAKAVRATGISRTTLQSRLLAGEVLAARAAQAPASPTIVPLALPDPIPLARVEDVAHQTRHFIVPDTQSKPGVPLDHMRWAGQYACVKRPDRIVHLGDGADMPSLSGYDRGTGKKSYEGQRYKLDIQAANTGMDLFMEPIYDEVERSLETDDPWQPDLHYLLGNHCDRITRAIEQQPELDGVISLDHLNMKQHGWNVYPFLDVVVLDGVAYSHYFTSGVKGLAVTSARALLTKKHQTCVMGHVQRYETAMDYNAQGKRITGLFASCYYQHEDGYRDAQSNVATWRGVHVLYGVHDGEFTHNSVSLAYLKDRFGGK